MPRAQRAVRRRRSGVAVAFCSKVLLSLGCLLPLAASAADWRITPHLWVSEVYTDNVTLAPKGQRQSDLITRITPGVSVNKTGNRLKVNASYNLETLTYLRDSRRNGVNHQLNASADAEWLEEFFLPT